MVGFEDFLKLMRRAHNNREFTDETLRFLEEIWVEVNQVVVVIQPEITTREVLFSDVDKDQIFIMAGESWCKISANNYVHMTTRKIQSITGDPVVTVQLHLKSV